MHSWEVNFMISRLRACPYQGIRNVRFSENLTCFVFLRHPFSDSPFHLITDERKKAVSIIFLSHFEISEKQLWMSARILHDSFWGISNWHENILELKKVTAILRFGMNPKGFKYFIFSYFFWLVLLGITCGSIRNQ